MFKDSDDDHLVDKVVNGKNVAKDLLAVVETLISHHFGDAILDDPFSRFAHEITT